MPVTSRRVLFNEGEGLTHTDLNRIGVEQANMSLDRRLYPNMVWAQAALDGGNNYSTQWDNADFVEDMCFLGDGLSGRVFATKDTTSWSLTPGMYYQYVGAGKPVAGGNRCLEYQVDTGEVSGTVTPPGSGTRFDRLEMKLTSAAGDSQTRDFEDATTRAKTTTSFNKSTQTSADFRILQGTLNAGPDKKGLIDGYVPVAYLVVTSAGIQSVHSVGHRIGNSFKTYDAVHAGVVIPDANWSQINPASGSIGWTTATAFSKLYIPFPFQSTQRILGIAIKMKTSATGFDLDLYRYRGSEARLLLSSFGPTGLTASVDQNVFIDFMPELPTATPSAVDVHSRETRAFWMNYGGDGSANPYTHIGNDIHGGNHPVLEMDVAANTDVYEFKFIYID